MAYANRANIEAIFGVDNVAMWANLSNGAANDAGVIAEVTARVTWALAVAEAWINSKLYGGPYTIPFSGTAPVLITDAAARLAGVLLYDNRGAVDVDANGNHIHKLSAHRRMVEAFIIGVNDGTIALTDATQSPILNTHPSAHHYGQPLNTVDYPGPWPFWPFI